MRTQEEKEKILDRYKPSHYKVGVVSEQMIGYLIDKFNGSEKIVKYKEAGSKGPIVMNYSPDREGKQDWTSTRFSMGYTWFKLLCMG